MQIRCKTCGQLLYVPDNSDGKTIRCPACLEEFIFNSADFTDETAKHPAFNAIAESKPSGESLESEISDAMENGQSEKTNPVADTKESFPEYAMANSFVQTRIMKLQPLNLIDVITTSVRLFRRYFNLVLWLGLLLIIVNLLSLGLTYQIAPEMMNIQFQQTDSLAEKINLMVEFQKKTPIQTQILVCCVQYLSSFIIFYLFLGGMRIFLGIGRSQKVRFSLIFSCWNAIGRIILAIFALIFLLTGIVLAASLAVGIILSIGIAPSIAMGLGFVGFLKKV